MMIELVTRSGLSWLLLVCLLSDLPAADTRVWKAGVVGDWFDAANWSDGRLPGEGDSVVIAPDGSRVMLDRSPPQLGHVVVEASLVFNGWETVLRAQSIEVSSGGIIGLPGPFREFKDGHRIQLESSGRLFVAAGGRIDATACGFAGGVGSAKNDDATSAGFGPGAGGFPTTWGASAGGSYGGRGGTVSAVDGYGEPNKPTQPGSGGGGGNGWGGAGGGAIRITAGEIVVDGIIWSNGGDVVERTWGGGGSGGSVWLTAVTISGCGRIEANGGWGSVYAGGGGGGRVAIEGRRAGDESPRPIASAIGGANGRCGIGVEDPMNFGEPGTVFFSAADFPARVWPSSAVVLCSDPTVDIKNDEGTSATIAYWMPWRTNVPIATVTKSLYREHKRPHAAEMTARYNVGPRLELMETHSVETQDDVGENITAQWSIDNGRSWSEPVAVQASNNIDYGGVTVWEGGWANTFDPTSGRLVQMWLRQIQQGGLYHCFTYSRWSRDMGRTWSEPQPLRYEDGPDFNPDNPLDEEFLNRNEGYPGNAILVHSSGMLIHCLAHANAAGDPKNNARPWRMGSRLMLGRWNPDRSDYDWSLGATVEISPQQSARGLMEPDIAELDDKRLLVVWRGSDQGWDGTRSTEPGRKWFSLSTDGGRTLTPPQPWHYDDGTPFFSASSIHRFIRHSNGRLYWVGNISVGRPQGNSPRYPLLIAEVDEGSATLRKHTVTTIDDRDPDKHDFNYQLSNFSLLENRETHELELFLTTYGQIAGQENWNTADSVHYRVQLK